MKNLFLKCTVLFFAINTACHAESFQGIKAEAPLAEVKAQFPNVTLERVKAAWVTESDGFFKLSGTGFPGILYLAFKDPRPYYREQAAAAADEATKTAWKEAAALSEDKSLWLKWMRWVPEAPLPIARFVGKYGKPEKSGFSDNDMKPYASWPKRGVFVNLSDDEKRVESVEYSFTKEEAIAACHSRNDKATWATNCNN